MYFITAHDKTGKKIGYLHPHGEDYIIKRDKIGAALWKNAILATFAIWDFSNTDIGYDLKFEAIE